MAAERGEEAERPPANFFIRTLRVFEAALHEFLDIFYSVSTMKMHLLVYFLWILLQLFSDGEKEPPPSRLIFIMGEGIAIVFAMMAITSNAAAFLLPLALMACLECGRFLFHAVIIIFYMNGKMLLDRQLFFMPEMIETGLEPAVLLLCLLLFLYFSVVVSSALFLYYPMQDLARRQAEHAQREHDSLAHRLPAIILQMPPTQTEVVVENSDSPPNYSIICRQSPEAIHTAKSETSPPRYSRLERREV